MYVVAYAEVACVYVTVFEEVGDASAYLVVACFAEEYGGDAGSAYRHDAVERGAAGDGGCGRLTVKDDVHNGLAHSYYFAHVVWLFCGFAVQYTYFLSIYGQKVWEMGKI